MAEQACNFLANTTAKSCGSNNRDERERVQVVAANIILVQFFRKIYDMMCYETNISFVVDR